MASIELVDDVDDGQVYHKSELVNRGRVNLNIGLDFKVGSATVTIAGNDLDFDYPAMNLVLWDGTNGKFILHEISAGTATATTNGANGDPRTDAVVVNAVSGSVSFKTGTPTTEDYDASSNPGGVREAPMPAITDQELLIAKVRFEANATVIATDKVWGRLPVGDIYAPRRFAVWAHDGDTNPTIGVLPAETWVDVPIIQVTEAFDVAGYRYTVGHTTDDDFLAEETLVDSTGIKFPLPGSGIGYNDTQRTLSAEPTAGSPTAGKALFIVPWHFVEPEAA